MKTSKRECLVFKQPKKTNLNKPFELIKYYPAKPYQYVSDFFKDNLNLINDFNIVILFSKKNMGKSTVGYWWMKDYFKKKLGNMVYGRLQELEKKNAKSQMFMECEKLGLKPHFKKGMGSDYIFFDDTDYSLRLVNLSSYQGLRGAIGDDTNFIWFDEINAYNFPPHFEDTFINIISTLGRNNNFKLFMSGNNETGQNNPVLASLQLKFNWNFDGVQLAMREVNGVKILGIQLGAKAFKETEVPLAETLAKFNLNVYNTYYLGKSNTNASLKIINLWEDYDISKPLFYWAHADEIYSFNTAHIHDKENGVDLKDGIIVRKEACNYEDIKNTAPLYTTDASSDLLFSGSVHLTLDQASSMLAPYYQALKHNKMYFGDFDSNDTFLNLLLPTYHLRELQRKETWYDEQIKTN